MEVAQQVLYSCLVGTRASLPMMVAKQLSLQVPEQLRTKEDKMSKIQNAAKLRAVKAQKEMRMVALQWQKDVCTRLCMCCMCFY